MTSINDELDDIAIKNDARQGELILEAVYEFLGHFVVYPSEHARVAHVLWVAHTHLMAAWESTPRIAFLSPEPASGKTRSMEVSELLVPDPVAAVNVTPAYLFRKCGSGDAPPTILFDEIDTVFGARARENEELRALLNSGHRRGATAGRCVVRGKNIETEEISSYAAVALAGLGWLPDTILSRSIIIRMRRRAPDERIEPFRRRVHGPQGEGLRRRLAGWAAGIIEEATQARPEMPPGVEDRAADMWEPLVALADIAGDRWPQRAREAAVALIRVVRDEEPSLGLRLLADLRAVFGNAEEMSSKDILQALAALDEAPWGDINGKPLDARGLANHLRPYGVKSITVRPPGEAKTSRGYKRAALLDSWRRYLPPPSAESPTQATQATQPPPEAGFEAVNVSDVSDKTGFVSDDIEPADPENANETGPVSDVSDVSDLPGDRAEEPPGLSWRAIDRLAQELEEWADARRDTGVEPDELEAEIGRRLAGTGIFPEAVEIETERVMRSLFETQEARRARAGKAAPAGSRQQNGRG